eukprot:TRINITY_DN37128_c0_g1_i1.p1 TRINITY_DN37128_c0_g1~~TRINITY_DN37128_c0_g1_i1.p1  ORF type:complete len:622 (-),score=89.51 TRINITY_DN37128_c0_g1_i1:71-1861(-)
MTATATIVSCELAGDHSSDGATVANRTLLHGGNIVTCVPSVPSHSGEPVLKSYEWMLVVGGKVSEIGSGVPPTIGDDVEVINLRGRVVLPGMFDSHCHVFAQGKMQRSLSLEGTASIEELQEKLRTHRVQNPSLEVIEGIQFDQELLGRFPTRLDLDVVDVPVVIYRRCFHICCVNTAGLKLCGIKGGETVTGGQVDVDDSGAATGILREGALEHFLGPLKTPGSVDLQREILREGADIFVRHGVTSVLTNDGELVGGISDPWDRYGELESSGDLPIRVFLTVDWKELDKPVVKVKPHSTSLLSVFRVKLWTDGALGASTAAVEEPYSDDPAGENRGILQIEPSEIRRIVGLAKTHGFGVEAHTIGDRSARELLDAFEEIPLSISDRYTLTHCQILGPELMNRMAKLGVVASVQPQFNTSDASIAPQRLGIGSTRLRHSYAWNLLRSKGVRLAGGSDAPVEVPDPLAGITCAMANDVHASENLSFAASLEMYTLGGAFAAFREHDLGALQEGFCADFVITSLVAPTSSLKPSTLRTATIDEVWVNGIRKFEAATGAREGAVTNPEGPGKRGLCFAVRGPCPCCGPRGFGMAKRLRI